MFGHNNALYMGKRKDNGEWIEGYCAYDMIASSLEDVSDEVGEVYGESPVIGFVDVDPDTICQYIGREDWKHRKIFEGHILDNGKFQGVVEWQPEICRYALHLTQYDDFILFSDRLLEKAIIIGHVLDRN